MYCAIDRFYGPRGVKDKVNPAYVVYSKEATETIDMCKPETEDVFSRTVASYHRNKSLI
jgi:hypothetical protein